MLILMAAWGLLLVVSTLVGAAMLEWSRTQRFPQVGDRLVLSAWLGTGSLASVLLTVALWVPLSPLVGALVAGVLAAIALATPAGERSRVWLAMLRPARPWHWLAGLGLAVAVAVLAQGKTLHDSGLYHLQLLRWLGQAGSVPGLGLIHDRFGFTSVWFALAVPFSPEPLLEKMVGLLGGYGLALALLHLLVVLRRLLIDRQNRLSDWFLLIFTVGYLPMLVGGVALSRASMAASVSPNLPIVVLSGLVLWVLLKCCEDEGDTAEPAAIARAARQSTGAADAALLLLLAAIAVAIKLSALPLGVAAFAFALTQTGPRPMRLVSLLWLPALLVLPAIITSLVTTGCPLFPSAALCLDGLPWSVGASHARSVASNLGMFRPADQPEVDLLQFLLTRRRSTAYLIGCAAVAAVGLSGRVVRCRPPVWSYIVAVALLGIGLFFRAGVDLRFGLSYLLLLPAYAIAVLAQRRSPLAALSLFVLGLPTTPWGTPLLSVGAIALSMAGLYLVLRRAKQRSGLLVGALLATVCVSGVSQLDFPQPIGLMVPNSSVPAAATVPLVSQETYDFTYTRPAQGNQCWAVPLICTPRLTDPEVRLRSPARSLRGGFMRSDNADLPAALILPGSAAP